MSRAALGLLFLLLAFSGQAQQIPSGEKEFTAYIAERLKKVAPALTFSAPQPLALDAVTAEGRNVGQLGLERVWQFCARNRGRCPEAVAQYVEGMGEVLNEQTRPLERASIRLVVRPDDYVQQARRQMAAGKAEMLARPLVANLWIVPVADSPRTMRIVTKEDLAALQLDEEGVFELGRRNLRERLKPLGEVARVPRPGDVGWLGEDDYESSRLILHGEWADLAGGMKHPLVVMVPASNLLLYGEAGNAQALEALQGLGREAARGSQRPLSLVLLRWTVAGWEIAR